MSRIDVKLDSTITRRRRRCAWRARSRPRRRANARTGNGGSDRAAVGAARSRRLRVGVGLRLGRQVAVAAAEPAIVDGEHREAHPVQRPIRWSCWTGSSARRAGRASSARARRRGIHQPCTRSPRRGARHGQPQLVVAQPDVRGRRVHVALRAEDPLALLTSRYAHPPAVSVTAASTMARLRVKRLLIVCVGVRGPGSARQRLVAVQRDSGRSRASTCLPSCAAHLAGEVAAHPPGRRTRS